MNRKWAAALAVTLMLAACGKRDHEEMPDNNMMGNEMPVDVTPVNDTPPPVNVTEPENKMAPPSVSELQQIQDDADASGMTSRLPDDHGDHMPADMSGDMSHSDDSGNAAIPH